MDVKEGDKVVLKRDCCLGTDGNVFVVKKVYKYSDCVRVSCNEFPYICAVVPMRDFYKLFEMQKGDRPTADKNSDFTSNEVADKRVDELIEQSEIIVKSFWDKCTIVSCRLPNGFVINESSACVDPENYDEEIGYKICIKRIKDKIRELEGYLLTEKLNDNSDDDGHDYDDECHDDDYWDDYRDDYYWDNYYVNDYLNDYYRN